MTREGVAGAVCSERLRPPAVPPNRNAMGSRCAVAAVLSRSAVAAYEISVLSAASCRARRPTAQSRVIVSFPGAALSSAAVVPALVGAAGAPSPPPAVAVMREESVPLQRRMTGNTFTPVIAAGSTISATAAAIGGCAVVGRRVDVSLLACRKATAMTAASRHTLRIAAGATKLIGRQSEAVGDVAASSENLLRREHFLTAYWTPSRYFSRVACAAAAAAVAAGPRRSAALDSIPLPPPHYLPPRPTQQQTPYHAAATSEDVEGSQQQVRRKEQQLQRQKDHQKLLPQQLHNGHNIRSQQHQQQTGEWQQHEQQQQQQHRQQRKQQQQQNVDGLQLQQQHFRSPLQEHKLQERLTEQKHRYEENRQSQESAASPYTFLELGIHSVLHARLQQVGISHPTILQASAFFAIDRGKDCVLQSRTGTGKTLAYLLPVINKIYKVHDLLLEAQLRPPPLSLPQHYPDPFNGVNSERSSSAAIAATSPTARGTQQHKAGFSRPLSAGRMLQQQLLQRQEELVLRGGADNASTEAVYRHAALPPLPRTWERLLQLRRPSVVSHPSTTDLYKSGSMTCSEKEAAATANGRREENVMVRAEAKAPCSIGPLAEGGKEVAGGERGEQKKEGEGTKKDNNEEEEDLSVAEQLALLEENNPLGGLRPVVVLVPTQDLVIEVLRMLQQIDVLGRVQVQCLSSVASNVAVRETAAETEKEKENLLSLQQLFRACASAADLPQRSNREQEPEQQQHDSKKIAQNLQTYHIDASQQQEKEHSDPFLKNDVQQQQQGRRRRQRHVSLSLQQNLGDSTGNTAGAESRRERSFWERRRDGRAATAALEKDQKSVETEREKKEEDETPGSATWLGQRIRRPMQQRRSSHKEEEQEGLVVATEIRPFSQKKEVKIHKLHLDDAGSFIEETWETKPSTVSPSPASGGAGLRLPPTQREDEERHGLYLESEGRNVGDSNSEKEEEEKEGEELQQRWHAETTAAAANAVEVCPLPVLYKPRIRWGAVDVVISTPHAFCEDMVRFRGDGLLPCIVIFDEVDLLLQARGSATLLMDIIGYCRPRPPVPCPLVATSREAKQMEAFPPCQLVLCGATLPALGPCSGGVMVLERFGAAAAVSSRETHRLREGLQQLWIRLNDNSIAAAAARMRPQWRSERADATVAPGGRIAASGSAAAATAGRASVTARGLTAAGRGMLIEEEEKEEELARDSGHLLPGTLFLSDNTKRKRRLQASWLHRIDVLLALLHAFPCKTIVFVRSVARCIHLHDFLRDKGWPVVAFHSKMSMRRRVRSLNLINNQAAEDSSSISRATRRSRSKSPSTFVATRKEEISFIKEGNDGGHRDEEGEEEDGGEESDSEDIGDSKNRIRPGRTRTEARVLVATDLASRGFDLPRVQHIVNFDFPTDAVTYIHRAGRTCRGPWTQKHPPPTEAEVSSGGSTQKVDASAAEKTGMRNGKALVSNLLDRDDMALASSLCELQQQGRPLHAAFSRRKSFKARYRRGAICGGEATAGSDGAAEFETREAFIETKRQEEETAGSPEAETASCDKAWHHLMKCLDINTSHSGTGFFADADGQQQQLVGSSHALRARDREGSDVHWRKHTLSATEGRNESVAEARPFGSRGRICSRTARTATAALAKQVKVQRSQREKGSPLAEALLQRLLWSQDGKNACVLAPYSFYDHLFENDSLSHSSPEKEMQALGVSTTNSSEAVNCLDASGGSNSNSSPTRRTLLSTSLGEDRERINLTDTHMSIRDTLQQRHQTLHSEDTARSSMHSGRYLFGAKGDIENQKMKERRGHAKASHSKTERIETEEDENAGITTSKAIGQDRRPECLPSALDVMRASLFEDSSSDDEDSLKQQQVRAQRGARATQREAALLTKGKEEAEGYIQVRDRGDLGKIEDATQELYRIQWSQEEYERFVVRRFQQQHQPTGRHRRSSSDQTSVAAGQMEQRAAEFRMKMLYNNFGAGDDFDDEDLKV